MTTHPPCLAWRDRLALRREDLSLADQQALDAHLSTCQVCAAALADYHFFEARLDALPPPTIKPLPRLSPLFFAARTEASEPARAMPQPGTTPRRARQKRRPLAPVWHALSVAVVGLLIITSVLLFRQLAQAGQGAHPLGPDTRCELGQHTGAVTAVAWSPNGDDIATASQDHSVTVWNALNCALLNTYWGHSSTVEALAWSHNSQFLASASDDGTVQVWNALNATSTPSLTYRQHHSTVLAVAWSPDDQEIASGGDDDQLLVWNARTGTTIWSYIDQQVNQTEPIDAVAWSPDGSKIAIGSWNDLVQVFDARQGNGPLYSYDGYSGRVNAIAWSPNNQYIAAASDDSSVQIWQANAPQEMDAPVSTYTVAEGSISAVAWSPDGQYVASGGTDDTVHVWNAFTGTTLKTYHGHTSSITSLSWKPAPSTASSDELVSGSSDHTALVWSVNGM